MGDRTWLEFWVKKEDKEAFVKKLDELGWGPPDQEDGTWILLTEVNYGGDEIIEDMAEHFDFHGGHGNGDNYGAMVFAVKDKKITWCMATHDHAPVVSVDKYGEIYPLDMANALEYLKIRNELSEN